jgi:hypothetical protein
LLRQTALNGMQAPTGIRDGSDNARGRHTRRWVLIEAKVFERVIHDIGGERWVRKLGVVLHTQKLYQSYDQSRWNSTPTPITCVPKTIRGDCDSSFVVVVGLDSAWSSIMPNDDRGSCCRSNTCGGAFSIGEEYVSFAKFSQRTGLKTSKSRAAAARSANGGGDAGEPMPNSPELSNDCSCGEPTGLPYSRNARELGELRSSLLVNAVKGAGCSADGCITSTPWCRVSGGVGSCRSPMDAFVSLSRCRAS